MRDYVDTTDDNGGVHINSGIPNKAFHVVATTLGGNAWEVAGQVWVDTITGDISADCDFATFARLTVAAATARHGADSEVVAAVRAGWDAVGVTSGAAAPSASRHRPTPSEPTTPARAPIRLGPATRARPPRSACAAPAGSPGAPSSAPSRWASCPTATPGPGTRCWPTTGCPRWPTQVAGRPQLPDTYCYGVRCETPPLDLELPELELTDDVRRLLERTLGTSDG